MATETIITKEAPGVEARKLGLMDSAKALADVAIDLPDRTVAPMTKTQTDALQLGKEGIGAYQAYLEPAGYLLGDAADALDPNQISQFMNPYQDAIQAEIDRAYDIQAAQAGLGAVGQPGGPSAFGGSRAAIQQAEIGRNRAAALAQAQAQNFLQAQQAQAAQADALGTLGLRQASLGELAQGLGQQDVSFALDLGGREQAQQQAEAEQLYQNELAQAYEPFQRYSFLSDIYSGAPSSQQTISSAASPGGPSAAQTFLGLGISGLSAAAGAKQAGLFG